MSRVLIKGGITLYTILIFIEDALARGQSHSLGHVANNLMGPVGAIISMLRAVCIISGIGLLLGAMTKYSDHRQNRQQTTLPTIFMMIVAGAALIIVAFIPLMNVKTE